MRRAIQMPVIMARLAVIGLISLGLCRAFAPDTAFAQSAGTQVAQPPTSVLFRNVRVFSGKGSTLSGPTNVLVTGNVIKRISRDAIQADPGTPLTVIEGAGRTLMPGLIDAHIHLTFNTLTPALMASADPNYLSIRSAVGAREVLMDGFTSVRDVSGPAFGMKRAIDEGLLPGPRIWPSGPMISQTSGHSDNRTVGELPASVNPGPHPSVRYGYVAVADGVDAMHRVVRENLMRGASQIKLAVGGGVSSNFDPIDVTEYTRAEIEAAVADAENWGTYVAVHGYTPKAIRLAVDAGVKCIDHGQLIDEPTMQLLAKRGVWLSLQPFLDDEDRIPTAPGSENERKYKQVAEGTDRAYKLARKHGVKVAFGTDIQFNPNGTVR
jgi:imidazolonepropionase-like amidohydrolase